MPDAPPPLTDADLAAMDARVLLTGAGPWEPRRGNNDGIVRVLGMAGHYQRLADCYGNEALAEFIAHARDDVPRLVAEVRRLRAIVQHAYPPLAPPPFNPVAETEEDYQARTEQFFRDRGYPVDAPDARPRPRRGD